MSAALGVKCLGPAQGHVHAKLEPTEAMLKSKCLNRNPMASVSFKTVLACGLTSQCASNRYVSKPVYAQAAVCISISNWFGGPLTGDYTMVVQLHFGSLVPITQPICVLLIVRLSVPLVAVDVVVQVATIHIYGAAAILQEG